MEVPSGRLLSMSDRRGRPLCSDTCRWVCCGSTDRIGSGNDQQLLGFVAEKLPLKTRFPKAATRQRVVSTHKRHSTFR